MISQLSLRGTRVASERITCDDDGVLHFPEGMRFKGRVFALKPRSMVPHGFVCIGEKDDKEVFEVLRHNSAPEMAHVQDMPSTGETVVTLSFQESNLVSAPRISALRLGMAVSFELKFSKTHSRYVANRVDEA